MNTVPEVENVAGRSIFEDINNNNNTSNQHLISSLKTAIVEKPHLSLINNPLTNKGNNNFKAANDFLVYQRKC